jgi:hypothetical protein
MLTCVPASLRGGGIRGFSDLGGEEGEEEGQDYYTGGKASGMVVRDPKAPPSGSSHDIVSELMENARKYASSSHSHASRGFLAG